MAIIQLNKEKLKIHMPVCKLMENLLQNGSQANITSGLIQVNHMLCCSMLLLKNLTIFRYIQMKKLSLIAALLALGTVAVPVMAQQSPWMLRARAVYIDPANKSTGGVLPTDAISISSKDIPEVDVSYFFTSNWAAELILTYLQEHDVLVTGLGKVGTFKHLPPTLTLQYHFTPEGRCSPYLGAGFNYTRIADVNLNAVDPTAKLKNSSLGFALQAGVDYKIDKNWRFNLDLKRVEIRSDLLIGGNVVSNVKVDPWLVGVGVGYRF